MKWSIDFSASSLRFLKQNNLDESLVIEKLRLAFKKFKGEDVNINIKKLGGVWDGFYRIRAGKMRIIVEFQFDKARAYIEEIDWRGNAYR